MKRAVFSNTFLKNLKKLNKQTKDQIKIRIKQILLEPTIGTPLKQNLKGLFKYRYSQYRMIYKFDKDRVYFISLNYRKKVYKK